MFDPDIRAKIEFYRGTEWSMGEGINLHHKCMNPPSLDFDWHLTIDAIHNHITKYIKDNEFDRALERVFYTALIGKPDGYVFTRLNDCARLLQNLYLRSYDYNKYSEHVEVLRLNPRTRDDFEDDLCTLFESFIPDIPTHVSCNTDDEMMIRDNAYEVRYIMLQPMRNYCSELNLRKYERRCATNALKKEHANV